MRKGCTGGRGGGGGAMCELDDTEKFARGRQCTSDPNTRTRVALVYRARPSSVLVYCTNPNPSPARTVYKHRARGSEEGRARVRGVATSGSMLARCRAHVHTADFEDYIIYVAFFTCGRSTSGDDIRLHTITSEQDMMCCKLHSVQFSIAQTQG